MPKVSVVIASYNHSKYIRECIQSVLDQTFQDYEIVITDDGSIDRSVEVIRGFKDPRISLYIHHSNRGACIAINNCIRHALGQYIAVLNSDDVWEPTKLEKQVTFLDSHTAIGAVFTKVSFINETSQFITNNDFKYLQIFEKENRSREAWLNQFFYGGNCLSHPSVLIRKQCYDEIGLYDERMANVPDLDMWVRLCLKYEIHILDEKLVHFRVRDAEANASGDRPSNQVRTRFESVQLLNHYLKIQDKQILLSIFPEVVQFGQPENEYSAYFISRLAVQIEEKHYQYWGLHVLYNLLGDNVLARGLEQKYGFALTKFYQLTGSCDVFHVLPYEALQVSMKNRSKLIRLAFCLHWKLANFIRKYMTK